MACRETNAFGPVSTCRPLDFTQLFEESIFGIGVSSLFAIVAGLRIIHLHTVPAKSKVDNDAGVGLSWMDWAPWSAWGGVSLGVLVTWCLQNQHLTTAATIPAAVLDVLLVMLLVFTMRQESVKSHRPPLVASAYLSLSLLLDLARLRTYWLLPGLRVVAALHTAQSALKLTTLAFMLNRHHARFRRLVGEDVAPEQYAGLFGLGLWSWLNGFLLHGYRRGIATLNDLDSIDADLLSSKDGSALAANWRKLGGGAD